MLITGSIVTYHNSVNDIKKVVNSFLSTNSNTKLYVIDNSSNDNLKGIIDVFQKIEYVYVGKNLGYGSAHNIAIRKSAEIGSTYHVILNPDIIFNADVIPKICNFMTENSDIGLIMPKVTYPNGELQFLCKMIPTPLNLIGRRFLPKTLMKKIDFNYEFKFTDYNKITDVPILSGCFMFLRTSTLLDVNLFDENFFMYCEDFDLSRRINEIARTVYYPEVSIIHNHAKDSYKSVSMLFLHIKSAIYYFNKWGWIFDKKRKKINQKILKDHKKINNIFNID